jgi:chromate transporter
LIAVVFRMMTPPLKRMDVVALTLMLGVFIAIGVLRLPLQAVLLVAIPLSIGVTHLMRRKVAA